jgi:hypothetical protein
MYISNAKPRREQFQMHLWSDLQIGAINITTFPVEMQLDSFYCIPAASDDWWLFIQWASWASPPINKNRSFYFTSFFARWREKCISGGGNHSRMRIVGDLKAEEWVYGLATLILHLFLLLLHTFFLCCLSPCLFKKIMLLTSTMTNSIFNK